MKIISKLRFQSPGWFNFFVIFSWLHMLAISTNYVTIGLVRILPDVESVFHLSAWLFYSALYLLPMVVACCLPIQFEKTAGAVALTTSTASLLLIKMDSIIYQLYGFHINGFVINLIFTPGGIQSLGSTSATYISSALLICRIIGLQMLFYAASRWLAKWRLQPKISLNFVLLAATSLFVVQGGAYGVSDITKYGPVLDHAYDYPFFQRVRFRTLAKRVGIDSQPRNEIRADVATTGLNYPLAPMQFDAPVRRPNIILLVAESLRWDQLTPETMPNTWKFAARNTNFTNHYSSGNGTREALFGMFYGLYGSYWDNFLNARRSPLLMDRVQYLDYNLDLRTSASFSYPEFDKTLFANVAMEKLQQADDSLPSWHRDQLNTDNLIAFLEQSDRSKPFFSFYFLESTHASYSFPEQSARHHPYLAALDYANISLPELKKSRNALLNRYSNAASWVDAQLGRIYQALEKQHLLDDTIVIVTGDHGEEFLEHGAWGHNSAFVQQQTRVPLVVAMPGKRPSTVQRITTHLDISTTLIQTLGANNNLKDYSLGQNLFDESTRAFITLSDWHSIAVMTEQLKYRIPYHRMGKNWQPTNLSDQPLGPDEIVRAINDNKQSIFEALANSKRFSSPATTEATKTTPNPVAGLP